MQRFLLRLDTSRLIGALVLLCVFGVMLCGNVLTDRFTDDFHYLYSFADGTRIRSVGAIFASMRAHYFTANGRIEAHFFVQVFEMLPKMVFNVLNSGMFVLSFALCSALCSVGKKRSNFFRLALFSAMWVYMPAFGQVNFWLDGACNYLWAQAAVFAFLLPYVRLFLKRPGFLDPGHTVKQLLFALYAVFAGAYSENLSGAALFMAILFLLLMRFSEKRKVSFFAVLPILTGMAGYAVMVFSPGEHKSKSAGFSVLRLLYQAEKVSDRFHMIWVIVAALVILFFLSVSLKIDRQRLLLAGVLTCGGLGAGLIFAIARFFPARSLAGVMLLLTLACGVLLRELLECPRTKTAALCLCTLLVLSLCYWCPHGMKDIYLVHEAISANRQIIAVEKAAGNPQITLPIPVPATKYSALDGLMYLSPDDPRMMPNFYMAKYYGVDTILGGAETPVQ